LGRRTASEVAFFLACLFDGAAIALVAQIFHINSDKPDGIWWWAVGTLPFALVLDTLLLHVLYVALLAVFTGYAVFGFALNVGTGLFGFLWLPPNGAYRVPLLALPGLMWGYRKGSAKTVAIYAPLLAWWVILQPLAWRVEVNPIYFIGCVGALFLIVSECHAEQSELAIPYRFFGALMTAGCLIPLSYYEFNKLVDKPTFTAGVLLELVVIVVLSLLVVVSAGEMDRWSSAAKRERSLGEILGAFNRRRWLPLGLTLFFALLALWQALLHEPLIPTLLANVAMLALALWLIQLGLRENRGLPFAAGVLYFLIWAVLRYIDLFGTSAGCRARR
jgi:uncharacterized membrane protein